MMDWEGNKNDMSLNQLMGAFNHRIAELQQLILTRGGQVGEYTADLSALDVTVRGLEQQLVKIKAHLKDDAETLFKARTLIELSSQQQKKLQQIFADLPVQLPGGEVQHEHTPPVRSTTSNGVNKDDHSFITPVTKEKKGKGPPPRCYVSAEEFASLSSYMRGRLTLDKVNTAIDEIAMFAESNARLLAAQRNKLGEEMLLKALELREIAFMDSIKGKHFFTEADMRGQILKMDNTGKAILTVLRHLGRTAEVRVGRQRFVAGDYSPGQAVTGQQFERSKRNNA
ncbi:unnamed protein product [Calypogeia fissa]